MRNVSRFVTSGTLFIPGGKYFLTLERSRAFFHARFATAFQLQYPSSYEKKTQHHQPILRSPSRYQFIILKATFRMNGTNADDKVDEGCALEGTTVLATQVGGHRFDQKAGRKLGMLDCGNGTVLKALQGPPRGTRELTLYQEVFGPKCKDKDLLELRNFLPKYYGTETRDGVTFLVMQNLTCGFHEPNVLDLKMGRITYDPEASPEKQEHEVSKYPPLEKLGFQITGMMVHDNKTGASHHFKKDFCRSLTAENIQKEGLGKFFGLQDGGLRKDVLEELIHKLQEIESWFLVQKRYAFYASSLLIVYSNRKSCSVTSSNTQPLVSVKNESPHPGVKRKREQEPWEDENDREIKVMRSTDGPQPSDGHQSKTDTFPDSNGDHSSLQKQKVSSTLEEETTSKEEKESQLCHFGQQDGLDIHKESQPCGSGQQVGLDVNNRRAKEDGDRVPLVQIKMIDFAHVFPSSSKDENYLFGLQKLIRMLKDLQSM